MAVVLATSPGANGITWGIPGAKRAVTTNAVIQLEFNGKYVGDAAGGHGGFKLEADSNAQSTNLELRKWDGGASARHFAYKALHNKE